MSGKASSAGHEVRTRAPVHLIASEEPLLLAEEADRLRATLRAAGYGEREIFDLGEGVDWAAFAAASRVGSLFAARRLIELRLPDGQPGAEGARAILAWCESPPEDAALVVLAGSWSRRHEGDWSRAIAACGSVRVLWPPRGPRELSSWIADRLRGRGLPADRTLIELLTARTEGNLLACAQEIEKLAVLAGGGVLLDRSRLQQLVADDARFRVFDLTDAALSGDAARVCAILDHLRRQGEAPAALLPWIGRELAALAQAAHGTAAGEPRYGERRRVFEAALQRAPAAFWDGCLIALARAERLAKGHADPPELPPDPRDAWVVLERLLLAIALAPRSRGLLG